MTAQPVSPPTREVSLSPHVLRKLSSLRGAIRRRLAFDGFVWVAATLFVAALATLIVDYGLFLLTRQHMTVGQRLFIDMLALLAVGYIMWRKLVRPLMLAMSDEDLAQIVEKANPLLADRLISAMQFVRSHQRTGAGSPELIARIVDEANEFARSLRFADVVQTGPVARHALLLLAISAVIGGLWFFRPVVMNTWLARMVALSGDTYPKDTILRIDGPNRIRVGRGASLEVAVLADETRAVPAAVSFQMKFPSVGSVEETVPPAAGTPHRYVKKFEVVSEPFTFRVAGNDDITEEVAVEVAEPPALQEVTFSIIAPEYTRLRPQTISSAQGIISVPVNSVVRVTATSTKELSEASMLLDGVPASNCEIVSIADSGGRPVKRGVRGEFMLAAPKPFRPSVQLRFAMADSEGFRSSGNTAQYTLMLVTDKPPTLQLAAVGVSGQISARAMIPLQLTAKDDYGVKQLSLEWALTSTPEKRTVAPVATFSPEEREPSAVQHVFDLMTLSSDPARPAIPVGESIRLIGQVSDALPATSGGPNTVMSNPLTLKVVSDEDLLAVLVDSQRSLREQFRQAIAMQSEARGRTELAVERAKAKDGMPVAFQLAAESSDQQQQLNDRVVAMAGRFEELLLQMNNNRVGAEADRQRIRGRIISPLRDMTTTSLKKIVSDLARIKGQTDAQLLSDDLTDIAKAQEAAQLQMEAVLAEMVKVENAQQVEHGLKVIIDMSQRVQDITSSQRKVEGSPPPATNPQPGGKP